MRKYGPAVVWLACYAALLTLLAMAIAHANPKPKHCDTCDSIQAFFDSMSCDEAERQNLFDAWLKWKDRRDEH